MFLSRWLKWAFTNRRNDGSDITIPSRLRNFIIQFLRYASILSFTGSRIISPRQASLTFFVVVFLAMAEHRLSVIKDSPHSCGFMPRHFASSISVYGRAWKDKSFLIFILDWSSAILKSISFISNIESFLCAIQSTLCKFFRVIAWKPRKNSRLKNRVHLL